MSDVLVTGATGFVGAHVAADLLRAGWNVRGLVRPGGSGRERLPEGCRPVSGDILDPVALAAAADGCGAIVHTAARYSLARHSGELTTRTNILGTANVVDAARHAGARLVHTSSVETIGRRPGGGLADEESDAPGGRPVGAYTRSKLAAERLVLDAERDGLWAVVVNPTAAVGPADWRPTPTGRIVQDFLRGRIPAFVDARLNVVDVRDVAAGHRLALDRGRSGQRYILGCENITLVAFLRLLGEISGRRAPRHRLPHPVAVAIAAVDEVLEGRVLRREPTAPLDGARMAREHPFVSSALAIRELGLPQSPVETALADAVRWYRTHGYAP